jgi:hypothetical protein
MHGIPSMATGGSSAPTSHVEMSASADSVDLLPVAALPGAESARARDEEPADRGSPAHSMASHAWNACLAVLLMGVALLAVAAVRRLPALWGRPVALRMHGSIAWLRPPRPPDLAALCLLRT